MITTRWKFTLLFLLFYNSLFAQDPQFSQFYSNPVYLNPALVGVQNNYRISLNHRQQWGETTGYNTSSLSFDGTLGSSSGVGIQIMNDKQFNNIVTSSFFNGALSHRINIKKESQVSFGMGFGYYSREFNWQNLVFQDQLHARYGAIYPTNERFGDATISNFDFSAGIAYLSKIFVGGINLDHLTTPKEDFAYGSTSVLPMKLTIHVGGNLENKNFRTKFYYLSPNIIYERQGKSEYWNLGMYYANENWTIGSWYRVNESLIFLMGINIDKLRIGYSYDYTVAQYGEVVGNTHELSMSYHFKVNFPKRIKNTYKGKCPDFYKYMF